MPALVVIFTCNGNSSETFKYLGFHLHQSASIAYAHLIYIYIYYIAPTTGRLFRYARTACDDPLSLYL